MTKRADVKRCDLSVEEWADKQTFTSTEQIHIPDLMADRVIGQEDAVEVMRKAASQKRHVMLIGEPGTGKSMLANSMVEYLPKEDLQDIVAYHNPEDFNEPRVRVFPAGKGKAVVAEQKAVAAQQKNQKNTMYIYAIMAIIVIGLLAAIMLNNFTIIWIALLGALIILMFFRMPGQQRTETAIVPKVLVGHDPGDMPPFVDATGTHAGALLGDVRHDPFQSGGLETPSHDRLEAGDIHKANKGVLYIDEINMLKMESQQALLTAMQEKKMSITGQSERSSGALVKSEPVPCDFILVCAGNMDAIQGMHPALRSRIRGYGYEVYMRSSMPDTEENRDNITRFVAQEVRKDGKIPHFDKYAVAEILREAQRRSGRKGELTLRMRELGGLVRVAGDMAVQRGAKLVTADDVSMARGTAKSLEQQVADRYIEANEAYKMFRTSGEAVGMVNGLAALNASSNMAEYSGIVLPIVAEVSPSQVKRAGHIVATGQLGTIAKEAVENISAVIKKYTMTNLSDSDIHLQYIGTYDGVEGDSASITMATVIISALENIPIRQDLAMTGSLSVRGKVLPVGGVQPVVQAALRAVGSGIRVDDGVKIVAQGVAAVGKGVVAGGHTVHRQQPQPGLGIHLVDVVIYGKTDGVGAVVVGGDAVHQLTHGSGSQLGGRVHQFAALNEQLFEQGLTAGVLAALKGNDGLILAAHVLPVGDLSGVDVPQLLLAERLHGVVLVHDENQRVHPDGLLLQLHIGFLQLFLYIVRRFVHHQHPGGGVVQAKVLPCVGGGAHGDAAAGFLQVHAGGIGQHLRHQRDAGSAAVQRGKLLHGQERLRLLHSRGSSRGRGRLCGRGSGAAGGRIRALAGGQHPGGGAGSQPQQKTAAGNFSVFHKKPS